MMSLFKPAGMDNEYDGIGSRAPRWWRKVVFYGLTGAACGYLVLHPASLFIHNYFEEQYFGFLRVIRQLFSLYHLSMGIYFTIIGAGIGVLYGIDATKMARMYEEVRLLSIEDPLTALYNRRYFTDQLKKEVDRCQRYARSLSLIMLDIDAFKNYNDTHGHQRGDELLMVFASRVRELLRKPDFIARYGGEEFAVVMPETDREQARIMAERLREAVRRYPFPGGEAQPGRKLTVSLGIAEFPSDAMDVAELIRQADRALYQAKEGGRDRVVICGA